MCFRLLFFMALVVIYSNICVINFASSASFSFVCVLFHISNTDVCVICFVFFVEHIFTYLVGYSKKCSKLSCK